jgi:hypothetical protein
MWRKDAQAAWARTYEPKRGETTWARTAREETQEERMFIESKELWLKWAQGRHLRLRSGKKEMRTRTGGRRGERERQKHSAFARAPDAKKIQGLLSDSLGLHKHIEEGN